MALIFCDSFDHYQFSDFTKKWTAVSSSGLAFATDTTAPGWPGGGQALTFTFASAAVQYYRPFGANNASGVVGGWVQFSSNPTTINSFMAVFDVTTEQISLRGDAAGHITVSKAGTVLATTVNTITTGTWYHFELKYTINNTTGVIQLKVNGTDWIASTSGLNTRNTANNYANGFGFISPNAGGTFNYRVKGVYALDTSGTTANDFIGVNRICCLRPNGAGNYAAWTPNGANNYGSVGDTIADGDQTFNATTVANNIDTFVTDDLPVGSGTVAAIQHVQMARQDAGAARTMCPLTRIAGTDYAGTTVSLAASHLFYCEPRSVSPATAAAWTVSEINGAEFGYKLIS